MWGRWQLKPPARIQHAQEQNNKLLPYLSHTRPVLPCMQSLWWVVASSHAPPTSHPRHTHCLSCTVGAHDQRKGLVELDDGLVVGAEAADALDEDLVDRAHGVRISSSKPLTDRCTD